MKKSRKSKTKRARRKKNIRLYLFVLVIAFTASMSGSYFYFEKMFSFKSAFIDDIESLNARDKKAKSKPGAARLYETGYQDSEAKDILRKDSNLVAAENIIREYFSAYKVRLLDLYMDKRGIIYIDTGDELKRNFKGDALEELSLIAGLYKKIKSTVPDFTALMILIEGSEAESFGGHIDISRPIGEEIVESI